MPTRSSILRKRSGASRALHGEGVREGQEELVESRGVGGGRGAGGADPGSRRLGDLAPWTVPDQLPGTTVQGHAEARESSPHSVIEEQNIYFLPKSCRSGKLPLPQS
jgi:hypothetical protein